MKILRRERILIFLEGMVTGITLVYVLLVIQSLTSTAPVAPALLAASTLKDNKDAKGDA